MPKYATSVRFLVKEGEVDAFVAACETNPKYGEISSYIVKTGDPQVPNNEFGIGWLGGKLR